MIIRVIAALILGSVLQSAVAAHAATLLSESFEYAPPGTVGGKSGGTGLWTSNWSGAFPLSDPTTNLAYSNGGTLETAGNSLHDPNGDDYTASRTWNTSSLTDDGDVLWFSFLFHVDTDVAAGDLRLYAVGNSTGAAFNSGAGAFVNGDGTLAARINAVNSATLGYTRGIDNLIVGRITFSDTVGADNVRVWLNPALDQTPVDGDGVAISGSIDVGSTLFLRSGTNWHGFADEIRVGTTFADVTPVPEPATLPLAAVAAIGLVAAARRRRAGSVRP